jgi:hypothetical protein
MGQETKGEAWDVVNEFWPQSESHWLCCGPTMVHPPRQSHVVFGPCRCYVLRNGKGGQLVICEGCARELGFAW